MKNKTTRRKGQTITYDFIVAFALFLAILFFGFNLLKNIQEEKRWEHSFSEINSISSEISSKLLKSPGIPFNWNNTNVIDVGWEQNYPILNLTKLNHTLYMPYSKLKMSLGLNQYDVLINISYTNDTPYKIDGVPFSIGKAFDESTKTVIKTTRLALIEENGKRIPIVINIYVWSSNEL